MISLRSKESGKYEGKITPATKETDVSEGVSRRSNQLTTSVTGTMVM